MKLKQTKALENAVARGMLGVQTGGAGSPADRALICLLEEGNCHAAYIVERLLGKEQAQQAVGAAAEAVENGTQYGEQAGRNFYEGFMQALAEVCRGFSAGGGGDLLNSGHMLLYMMREGGFVSAQVLARFGLDADEVEAVLEELPSEEDYYADMNVLRKIHLFDTADAAGEHTRDEAPLKVTHAAQSVLGKYAVDLSAMAAAGDIDEVVGREQEIERVMQVLSRRKKNNPILVGEAGAGKSAIVEGLALRMAAGDVPPQLVGCRIFSLDMGSLLAGTKYRGEFEERVRELADELRRDRSVILFIDEIHNIVGTGTSQGGLDAANMLKPALARGELRCIGATTPEEYREHVEHDRALERRFQKVTVEPASKENTLEILRRIKGYYEAFHGVCYGEDALEACVELTDRYVTGRCFPDKAVDVLDEAGARIGVAHVVSGHPRKVGRRRAKDVAAECRPGCPVVTVAHIREVVSAMTGVPMEGVSEDGRARLREMQAGLSASVVGQERAVDSVVKALQRSGAGLRDPDRPIGVFLFTGPTGVGKTLLAKELARWMFGRNDALVRLDMGEYGEKHNVSRLVGSPPGYVGYGEGGQLTEAVRRSPYSVVLLDEIEKAHPDVFGILLQVFDDGRLTDGTGRTADFRNTVIIMTSNAGSSGSATIGYGHNAASDDEKCLKALEGIFPPEFLGRIDGVVAFNSLALVDAERITDMEFGRIAGRAGAMGYELRLSSGARRLLASLGFSPKYGARQLRRVMAEHVEGPLAAMIIGEEVAAGDAVDIVSAAGRVVLVPRRNTPRGTHGANRGKPPKRQAKPVS